MQRTRSKSRGTRQAARRATCHLARWNQKRLTAGFSFCRVVPAYDDRNIPVSERDKVWLVVEYRDDTGDIKYYLSSLPKDSPKKRLARIIKERYRTEQVYRELKGGSDWITSKGEGSPGGTTTSRLPSAATPSLSRKEPALFAPRADGPVSLRRSSTRPERHFADSFQTTRRAIALRTVSWLPRCPCCHSPSPPTTRASRAGPVLPLSHETHPSNAAP
jgi:hypothetical protein